MDNNQVAFHHRLAVMMNEIHKICVDNDINYTMIGGTLIGALRHKGFIPWDDDIDIGMTYDEYKKFTRVVFQLKHEWLVFDLAGITEDYYCPFIKAYDKRTTLLESNRDNPKGIFIDIFPFVYAGNTKEEALNEYRIHRFWQSLLRRKGYHFSTGALRESILTMMAKCFSVTFLMKKINKHYEKLNESQKYYISDMDGTEKGIVPSCLFSDYCLYQFEEFKFMGISKAHEYLTLDFGDYMQLPPIEKRQPHHFLYLNLDLPYSEYNDNIENE